MQTPGLAPDLATHCASVVHGTQVFATQAGLVAVVQSACCVHSTHVPIAALAAVTQAGRAGSLSLHCWFVAHGAQTFVSQIGFAAVAQCPWVLQATQSPALHQGAAALSEHCESAVQGSQT